MVTTSLLTAANWPSSEDFYMKNEVACKPITAERYISRDYMLQEQEKLWAKTWLIAGLLQDVEEPGDFFVFMRYILELLVFVWRVCLCCFLAS